MSSIKGKREGGFPKDDFTNKAYLVKVMTKNQKGGGVKKSQKIDDVFYERPLRLIKVNAKH